MRIAGGAFPLTPTARRVPRRRRRWRWVIAGLAAIVLIVLAVGIAFIELQSPPAPLTLAKDPVRPPAGPTDGSWRASAGSLAGFRLKESFLGISDDVVGRTSAVTGTMIVDDSQVTAVTFRVDPTDDRSGWEDRARL